MSFWTVLFRIHSVVNALDEIMDLVEIHRDDPGGFTPDQVFEILKRYNLWPGWR